MSERTFLVAFVALGLGGCQHAPLFIAGLDTEEIRQVSDERLCNASTTFVETRGRRFPVIENEIARRGHSCGANDVQIAAEASNAAEPAMKPAAAPPAGAETRPLRNANLRAGPGTTHPVVLVKGGGDDYCARGRGQLVRLHDERGAAGIRELQSPRTPGWRMGGCAGIYRAGSSNL
jgi:hypothetical protein